MNENLVAYADWVLLMACEKAGLQLVPSIADARALYAKNEFYRALCDMIAKHEQPPVDPDEEAVKRIIARACKMQVSEIDWGNVAPGLGLAVAQYKQEKANG